jgi:hypothetical protein
MLLVVVLAYHLLLDYREERILLRCLDLYRLEEYGLT